MAAHLIFLFFSLSGLFLSFFFFFYFLSTLPFYYYFFYYFFLSNFYLFFFFSLFAFSVSLSFSLASAFLLILALRAFISRRLSLRVLMVGRRQTAESTGAGSQSLLHLASERFVPPADAVTLPNCSVLLRLPLRALLASPSAVLCLPAAMEHELEDWQVDLEQHIRQCQCPCNHMGYGNYWSYKVRGLNTFFY